MLNKAEGIYLEQQCPFGSLHIDIPLALDSEFELFSEIGFSSITVERRWSSTAIVKAVK